MTLSAQTGFFHGNGPTPADGVNLEAAVVAAQGALATVGAAAASASAAAASAGAAEAALLATASSAQSTIAAAAASASAAITGTVDTVTNAAATSATAATNAAASAAAANTSATTAGAAITSRIKSVLEFGAVSGAANSQPAFQAAASSGARSILVPAGTWALSSDVTASYPKPNWVIDPGATFTGVGRLPYGDPFGMAYTGRTKFGSNLGGATFTGVQVGGAGPDERNGLMIFNDGSPSWGTVQTTARRSGTSWQIYASDAGGLGQTLAGTNKVQLLTFVDLSIMEVGDRFYFGSTRYEITGFESTDKVLLKNTDGSAVSFGATASNTWHYVYGYSTGTCKVVGTSFSKLTGDPVSPFSTSIKLNGVAYTMAASSGNAASLTTAPGDGTYTYAQKEPTDVLAMTRLQKMWGADEENLGMWASADGFYAISSLYGGGGKYRPILMSSGEVSGGNLRWMVELNPDTASVSLGGRVGNEGLRVLSAPTGVSRFETGAAPAGFAQTLSARGAANVGMAFDTSGTGAYLFTAGTFARALLGVVGGASATAYVEIGGGAAAATVQVKGTSAAPATNADLNLAPLGTGGVRVASTAASTSTTTGALTVAGGLGVAGDVVLGGDLSFTTAGLGAPTFATRSAGVKAVLYPNIGASTSDFAIGVESGAIWMGVNASSDAFKWYAGTTQVASLSGLGVLNLTGAGAVQLGGTQVLTSRRTGWTAWTGTAARGTFDTSTATLANVAQALKALTDDLRTHGLIGT